MSSTTMVHVRVDEKVKAKATAAENALPFEVRVPNATTVKAMQSAGTKEGKRFRSTEELFEDLGI
jgi:DNA-damage-inducible protein J